MKHDILYLYAYCNKKKPHQLNHKVILHKNLFLDLFLGELEIVYNILKVN